MPAALFNFHRFFKKSPPLLGEDQNQRVTSLPADIDSRVAVSPKPMAYSGIGPPTIDMQKRVGMDVLSRLTQRANTLLMQAVGKARELKVQYIDTEHVLWGLLQDGSIYQLISDCKVTPAELTAELTKSFKPGNFPGQPQFSPRVKRVLELSLSAARSLGYEFVSPEHILLALSHEGEGLAARILAKFNLKPEALNQKITGKKALEKEEEKKKASALEEYTEDLTVKAAQGLVDPVVGRTAEIERIIHIISRRTKNNPVLIGDAGVGKTAIVEGLAQWIASGRVPETLLHKRILLLDLMSLIAGAKHRGEFEERLKNLIKEVKAASGAIILFIDEVHNMVGAGSGSEGTMDASNILKPSLARGELQVIGTTTIVEYRKYIEKDPALERRFQPIYVAEPTAEVAIEMLKALRDKYEAFHRVKIEDKAIEAAVKLSQRYIGDRFLPDKAVDLIDEGAASVRLPAISLPEEITKGEEKVKKLENEKKEREERGDKVRFDNLEKEIEELKERLLELKEEYQLKKSTTTNVVTPEIIAEIVSRWTNIPVSRLTESESRKLLELEEIIHQRLVDQEEAVTAVAEAVRRGRAGLKSGKRPIGSFIFMGPTGVGKTELAKTLAETLFGSEETMVRLDMTEYMEKHEVAKLIGAPPGYVGYEEGGQLTEAVRRRPYSVVLLDEIEKAHPDVFNILIQLLDDGRLTDNKGHTVSFKNTIVICTSNLGSGIIQEEMAGWGDKNQKSKIKNQKEKVIFKTYTISPTGREIITFEDKYWEKDPQANVWKVGKLADYFAGSTISGEDKTFPLEGFDTHLIASDGSETITSDNKAWFRTSTATREWTTKTLLERMKDQMVVNALPDRPEEQLPTAKIDTQAISPSGVEIITFGERFWRRENLQTKDWITGKLREYFKSAKCKMEGAKLEDKGFPIKNWDIHLFRPDSSEIIIAGDKYWTRKTIADLEWTVDNLDKLFTTLEVEGEREEGAIPLGRKEMIGEESPEEAERFKKLAERLMEELRKFFRPELLNRFDEVVVFRPLTRAHMIEIVDLQVKALAKLLEEQGVLLQMGNDTKTYLSEVGFDPVFGARPLRRTIQRLVENPISSLLIKSDLAQGDTVIVDYDGEKLTFDIKKPAPKKETPAQKEETPQTNLKSYQSIPSVPQPPEETVLSPEAAPTQTPDQLKSYPSDTHPFPVPPNGGTAVTTG